jgi:von Willebrand factor A domain-containing protein 8
MYCTTGTTIQQVGNQGVGKNKLADKLLSLLQAEREYVQLHRDTTVASLTAVPALLNGRIIYQVPAAYSTA